MARGEDVCYRLNARDEFEFVNEAWDRFAEANDGGHLAGGRVLGHPLWDFVGDVSTRQLYRDVLARVRSGRPARFPFRCDSPACRRQMEMDLTPRPGGAVEIRTRTVSEEERPLQRLLDAREPRSGEFVRVCGWCKKVHVGGTWAEVEDALTRLALFERPALPPLTHGMCEDCFAAMTRELAAT